MNRPNFGDRRPLLLIALGVAGMALQLAPGCGRGLTDAGGHVGASAPVSPEGGAVHLGQASVQAPAGALSATTEITVERQQASDAVPLGGDVYHFGPDGLTFAKPVTMQLPSTPDSDAGIGLWVGDEWDAVAGSHYDAGAAVVVGDVMHFSRYAPCHLCSSGSACRAGLECRRGVCQPPRPQDAGASGGSGSGGSGSGGSASGGRSGSGGATGTGGGASGGTTGSGGGTGGSGTGGSGTGGSGIGSGGIVGSGGTMGSGGFVGSGGTMGSGGVVGSGGTMGSGGNKGSGGAGGAGTCPATQPPVVDMTCPNPPQTCDYGATRCICQAGRVWSCGPIGAGGAGGGAGGGGAGGRGGAGGAGGGSAMCQVNAESVVCKSNGTTCAANAECQTKLCSGSSGSSCPQGNTCVCASKTLNTDCNGHAECQSGYCTGVDSSGTVCLTDAACRCANKPCTSSAECTTPGYGNCLTTTNTSCGTGATGCSCKPAG